MYNMFWTPLHSFCIQHYYHYFKHTLNPLSFIIFSVPFNVSPVTEIAQYHQNYLKLPTWSLQLVIYEFSEEVLNIFSMILFLNVYTNMPHFLNIKIAP